MRAHFAGLLFVAALALENAARAASEAIDFVTWREPNEGAYTIRVPRGWKISGGIRRRTPVDVRSALNVVSPDSVIRLFIGDYDVPPAREPDAATRMAGLREGQIHDGTLLAHYQTGVAFAQRYPAWKLCRQARIVQSESLAKETQTLNAEVAQYGRSMATAASASVGEVIFRCGAVTQSAIQHARQQAALGSAGGWNHPNTGGVPKITRDPAVERRRDEANRGTRRVCDNQGTCATVDNSWTHVWRDHNNNTVPGPPSGYPPDYSGQWTEMK